MSDGSRVGLDIGDGCGRTARFVREEILSRFDNVALAELEDAAVVNVAGSQIAVSTDSYIVDPPIFPGGNIGRLAVCGTVNDLVASGAVPRHLTMGLVMSAGLEMTVVREVLDSTAAAAYEAGVAVVAGDTKVVPESYRAGICINTTGIGTLLRADRSYALRNARPGDAIIITGTIGDHSITVLSAREGLGFESRVRSDCAPLQSLVLPVLDRYREVHALRDVTRGGLRGVLCDLAESAGVDVEVNLDAVPVQEEVRAACEMLGQDPMDLVNEGKIVIVVAEQAADPIVSLLRGHPLGRSCAIIGRVFDRVGTRAIVSVRCSESPSRVLNRLEGQPIPRLC